MPEQGLVNAARVSKGDVMGTEANPNNKQHEPVINVGKGRLRVASYSTLPSPTTCSKLFHPHVIGLARQGLRGGLVLIRSTMGA